MPHVGCKHPSAPLLCVEPPCTESASVTCLTSSVCQSQSNYSEVQKNTIHSDITRTMSQIQLIERSMPIKTQPYRAKRRQPRKCTGAIFHSKAVMQQMWVTKKWRRFSMGFLNCQGHRLRTKIFEQDLKKRCGSSGFSCANKQTFLTKELFNASSKDFGCRCGVELVGPLFVHFSNPVLNVHKIAAHEL